MTHKATNGLTEVAGQPFPVLTSRGTTAVAEAVAARCGRAHRYLATVLGTRPEIRVLVLAAADWSRHASFPLYGMPHYTDEHTLVIAGEENRFWQAVAPPEAELSPDARRALHEVYGGPGLELRLSGFFDLLAVHELGHLFHLQAGREFPRLWLMELFCNVCLHAYAASAEPDVMAALETFPAVVLAGGHERLAHHTLEDFERLYVEVGPVNYGWYQCQLHATAKRIFDQSGEDVLRRFWDMVPNVARDVSNPDLAATLDDVHPELARTLAEWPPVQDGKRDRD